MAIFTSLSRDVYKRQGLSRHLVSGFQVEFPNLRHRNIDVLIARQVILAAQKTVSVRVNLQHAVGVLALSGIQYFIYRVVVRHILDNAFTGGALCRMFVFSMLLLHLCMVLLLSLIHI